MPLTVKLTRISIVALALALLGTLLCRPDFVPALSSDSLYIDDLWQSFFDGRGLSAWYLPPGPSYFPDLIIYGVCTLLADDLGLRHAWYALFEGMLLVAGVAMIGRKKLGMAWERAWWLGLAGMGLFVALMAPQGSMNLVFAPTHHGGAMLASLWIFALSPEPGARVGKWGLLVWGLAAFALAISDSLALAWGIIPAVVLCLRMPRDWRWIGAVFAGIFLASVLGSRWHAWGGPSTAHLQMRYFISDPVNVFKSGMLSAVEMVKREPWASLVACLWFVLAAWRGSKALAWYAVLGVLFSGAVLVMTGSVAERHFFPLFYFPAAFLLAALPERFEKALAVVGLVLALVLALRCGKPQDLRAPYPRELEQLELALGDPSQVSGFAEYWQARRLRMLSRHGLWLDPVGIAQQSEGGSGFGIYTWMHNSKIRMSPHAFFVMNSLDAGVIESIFGKAREKRMFGELEFWYYGESMDKSSRDKKGRS